MSYILTYVVGSSAEALSYHSDRLSKLRREGFEIDLCVGDTGGLDELSSLGFRVRPFPYGRSPAHIGAAFILIHSHLIERPPVLCHGFGAPWAWVTALAARSVDAQTCVATIEEHYFVSEDVAKLGPVLTGLEALSVNGLTRSARHAYRWLGENVDRYLCTNERDFRILENEGLVEASRRELILGGRGVDLEVFDPQRLSRAAARRELGLDTRSVISAPVPGDADSRQILEDVLQRFESRTDLSWVLVEDERRGDLFKSRGVRVVSTSHRYEAMRAADLWLDPRLHDSFGLDLMRAAASGRAVVAFDTPAATTVVVPGHTGVYTTQRSAGELAALAEILVADPRRLEEIGIRARSRSVSRFSRTHVDDQIMGIYDRILSRRLA